MATTKRKPIAVITAVTATAAILLSGTFAWQSISQQAKNEVMSVVNPGGRLHDDFDGRNKDVYVENFTDPNNGGVPIYARVRLDEYMELGPDAGRNQDAADRKADSLVDGADIRDVTTWTTHIPGAGDDPFHTYWKWTTGGSTIFMPTFNKNKDSLKADINGTYEGTTAGDAVHFDDYQTYTDGEQKTADSVYDADRNDTDEGEAAVEGDNITTVTETHTAKVTGTATLLTMQEWIDAGAQPGPYWVYDVDGWAYWAQPIAPGETTGLLLDGITLQKEPDENWYYSINVVGQFATVGDWGSAESGDGFFGPDAGPVPTDNALALLNKIAGLSEDDSEEAWDSSALAAITPGSTDTVTIDGREWYVLAKEDGKALIWAKEAEMTFGTNGKGEFNPSYTDGQVTPNGYRWEGSQMQTWLNGEYLNSLTTLGSHLVETNITTREEYNAENWITSTDKVFLLSEADLFGTINKEATSDERDYTYGNSQLVTNIELRHFPKPVTDTLLCYWLRSPYSEPSSLAVYRMDDVEGYDDTVLFSRFSEANSYVRPAMWVAL